MKGKRRVFTSKDKVFLLQKLDEFNGNIAKTIRYVHTIRGFEGVCYKTFSRLRNSAQKIPKKRGKSVNLL